MAATCFCSSKKIPWRNAGLREQWQISGVPSGPGNTIAARNVYCMCEPSTAGRWPVRPLLLIHAVALSPYPFKHAHKEHIHERSSRTASPPLRPSDHTPPSERIGIRTSHSHTSCWSRPGAPHHISALVHHVRPRHVRRYHLASPPRLLALHTHSSLSLSLPPSSYSKRLLALPLRF